MRQNCDLPNDSGKSALFTLALPGDGMQTAALADCEGLRTNRRHAHLRQPKKRLKLIYCN